jgi:hypothetical protein
MGHRSRVVVFCRAETTVVMTMIGRGPLLSRRDPPKIMLRCRAHRFDPGSARARDIGKLHR